MTVTRRDLEAMARSLHESQPLPEMGALAYGVWLRTVVSVAEALSDTMGLDLNGNRRFRSDRFYTAVGLPDQDYRR